MGERLDIHAESRGHFRKLGNLLDCQLARERHAASA